VFDTSRERIVLDHVLASAGLIPDLPAREIGGRWLGDGALSANAPVSIVLAEPQGGLVCFMIDSFPPKAPPPTSWFEASERPTDLIFANQIQKTLEAHVRLDQLRRSVRDAVAAMPSELRSRKELIALAGVVKETALDVICMEYRAGADELGMKWFDFSASVIQRVCWPRKPSWRMR
jgi:NTE family protein